jgi:hypothetical protein
MKDISTHLFVDGNDPAGKENLMRQRGKDEMLKSWPCLKNTVQFKHAKTDPR